MVDRYTKVVLTIIAVCLTVIAAKDVPFTKMAVAQQPTHVLVDGFCQGAIPPFSYVCAPVPVKAER
jgi:hypothetical protein